MKIQTDDPKVAERIDAFIEKSKAQGWDEGKIKSEIERKAKEEGWKLNARAGATGAFNPSATGSWKADSGDSFYRGFVKDPITGLQQMAAESEIVNLVNPDWAKGKKAEILQQEKDFQSARGTDKYDFPRLTGNIVNPVNLAIMGATKIPPTATLPQMAAISGAQGSLMSGVAPVYEGTRAGQARMGAIGGVVAAPIAKGLSRIVKPNVSSEVDLLRKEGVKPTIGQSFGGAAQRFEDKLTSLPILGDAITNARQRGMKEFQVAAYNRALTPIGAKHSGTVGQAGVQEVRQTLQSSYDDLLSKMNFKPDQKFMQDSSSLRQMVSLLPTEDQKTYDAILNKVMSRATPQGNMSGTTFKNVESSLTEEISKLAKDGRYEKTMLADALAQYRDLMKDGLGRSNPMWADRLSKVNEGWKNYAVIRRAASGPQSSQTGTFTPSQLMQGVQESAKRGSKAAARSSLSEGRATMQDLANAGYAVLPSKYPDSGTVGRSLADAAILGGAFNFPHVAKAATGLGVASIPYLPGGRAASDLLLNARPKEATLLADTIRKYPGLFAPILPSLINE